MAAKDANSSLLSSVAMRRRRLLDNVVVAAVALLLVVVVVMVGAIIHELTKVTDGGDVNIIIIIIITIGINTTARMEMLAPTEITIIREFMVSVRFGVIFSALFFGGSEDLRIYMMNRWTSVFLLAMNN